MTFSKFYSKDQGSTFRNLRGPPPSTNSSTFHKDHLVVQNPGYNTHSNAPFNGQRGMCVDFHHSRRWGSPTMCTRGLYVEAHGSCKLAGLTYYDPKLRRSMLVGLSYLVINSTDNVFTCRHPQVGKSSNFEMIKTKIIIKRSLIIQ